ncbi:MAG: 30S ribosomal protein S21 [Acidiferrobacterales bacterium]
MQREHRFKPLGVSARSGEPPEKMIKRFMRKVRAEGIIQELYERRGYEKPSAKNRRKRAKNAFLRKHEVRQ